VCDTATQVPGTWNLVGMQEFAEERLVDNPFVTAAGNIPDDHGYTFLNISELLLFPCCAGSFLHDTGFPCGIPHLYGQKKAPLLGELFEDPWYQCKPER
jgi:hypothetical protein